MTPLQKGFLCHTFHWGFINIVSSWYVFCVEDCSCYNRIHQPQHPGALWTKKGYGRQSLARLFELLRTGQQPEVGLGGLEPQEWGNKMPIKIGQFQKTRIQRSLRQVILRHTQIIPNTEIGEEFDMHLDYWVGSESKLHKSLCFLV